MNNVNSNSNTVDPIVFDHILLALRRLLPTVKVIFLIRKDRQAHLKSSWFAELSASYANYILDQQVVLFQIFHNQHNEWTYFISYEDLIASDQACRDYLSF